MADDNSSVKVAVRVRPLVESEMQKGSRNVIEVLDSQIIVKNPFKENRFTFNYAFDSTTDQSVFYDACIQPLIRNLFKGFNITILAYGQTGSGKTHTMGTAHTEHQDAGVIPRVGQEIFEQIRDNFSYSINVTVSFVELYQESLFDLLSTRPREQSTLEIREDNRGIIIPNLTELPVASVNEILKILQQGSAGRITGSTAMNSHSSRSHAIFTINLSMSSKSDGENKQARLNLVDLAGSERLKKTGAIGTTLKEGININKGLLVLGNVISYLGDEKTKNGYIPYRDSNLTRLLKDSLGGNSITLMIACISPADYNLDETISTLRYADKARKIQNKPIVNQDPKLAEINELKRTIQQLRLQIVGQGIYSTFYE
nr:unnamed protein product [Callosobruchus analis]